MKSDTNTAPTYIGLTHQRNYFIVAFYKNDDVRFSDQATGSSLFQDEEYAAAGLLTRRRRGPGGGYRRLLFYEHLHAKNIN